MSSWAKKLGIGAIGAVVGALAMYIVQPRLPQSAAIVDAWIASPIAWLAFPGLAFGLYLLQRSWWRMDRGHGNGWWTLCLIVVGLSVVGYAGWSLFSLAGAALATV